MYRDDLDLSRVVFHSTVPLPDYTPTVTLDGVEYRDGTAAQNRDVGVRPLIDMTLARARWPYVTPAGWDGPLRYTLWLFWRVAGAWHGAPMITMHDSYWGTGAPLLRQWHDWAYWDQAIEQGYTPRADDVVGFCCSAGVARHDAKTFSVAERTNVVVVPLQATGVFRGNAVDAGDAGPTPAPLPPPILVPTPTLPPATPAPLDVQLADIVARLDVQLADIVARLDALAADQRHVEAYITIGHTTLLKAVADVAAGATPVAPTYEGTFDLRFFGRVPIILTPKPPVQ